MVAQNLKFGTQDADGSPVRLGFGRFKFVKIQNRLTNDDGTANTATVFWGDAGAQPMEIVNQFTDWIPIDDVSDVWIRAIFPPGTALGTKATVAFIAADRIS